MNLAHPNQTNFVFIFLLVHFLTVYVKKNPVKYIRNALFYVAVQSIN